MNNIYKSLILLLILLFIGFAYYNYRTSTYITAEFNNLRPFHNRAPIYYNGYKIGNIVKVKPNEDYLTTIVTMKLYRNKLKLPINVSATLRKEKNIFDKKFDYIDLIYPDKPSEFFLKNGDRISGKTTIELESYLANQDQESLDEIKEDMAETVKNLNITVQALGDLFVTLNSMAEEVRPNFVKASVNINETTANLVKTSKDANLLTDNINESLSQERLEATAKNVQVISKNVKVMTNELNKTIPKIGCTLDEVNRVLCNLEEMTSGVNCTMKKSFGGFRILFGSPISKKNCNCK